METHTLTLSSKALEAVCRAAADGMADFGWDPYRKGYEIPTADRRQLVEWDDNVTGWLELYDSAMAAYREATGDQWRY
jgi:hypothetical protein